MIQVVNGTVSISEDFVEVPKPRLEVEFFTLALRTASSSRYVQNCEQLVFHVWQANSMVETLEIHEKEEWKQRVEIFKGWRQSTKSTWTWESKEQHKSWKGSSKRAIEYASFVG